MPAFGILNINKPVGRTSRSVVDCVERLNRTAKVGHAGTLDPLASGVLVICVGQATRLIQYVQKMRKSYRATFLLGQTSETDDVEAELLAVAGAIPPSCQTLERTLPEFVGAILQRPPTHSAIKIDGKRAYKLARRGVAVDIQPRKVTIHRIAVQRYEYPELQLAVECGSGTYIRSLGRDLGAALGTGAVMSALERTAIGPFRIEDAVNLDELTANTLGDRLQPALVAVDDLRHATLTEAQLQELHHGRPIVLSSNRSNAPDTAPPMPDEDIVALSETGELAAILFEKRKGELWPRMNFTRSLER